MEISLIKIVVALIILAISTLVGWWVWWQRKTQSTIEIHDQKITRLEAERVTADDVRSIVHQSNEPLLSAINGMRDNLTQNSSLIQDVLLHNAKKEGYETAMKELRKEH